MAAELDKLVDPATRGDPESPLRWTCKSTRKLADALKKKGFRVSHHKVGQILRNSGYSMQANRKTIEGRQHPDRDAQFEYINNEVKQAIRRNQPAISVDTKKKEKLGNMRNGGREWSPKGRPSKVKVHDFPDKKLGKVIPYGVYDIARNEGWVNVGVDHDTAQFAVASIQRWWTKKGKEAYPEAEELVITADSGGSNSSRSRAWRFYLQNLADKTGLRIRVRHFPPGTSKWNKIEHRMFCHITSNWRGKPLETREAVVSLIGSTTTRTGLTISAALDRRLYPTGRKFSDDDMRSIRMRLGKFHGEWNYTMYPRTRAAQSSRQ